MGASALQPQLQQGSETVGIDRRTLTQGYLRAGHSLHHALSKHASGEGWDRCFPWTGEETEARAMPWHVRGAPAFFMELGLELYLQAATPFPSSELLALGRVALQ